LLYYVLVCDASLSQDLSVEGLAIADFLANCCRKIQRFSRFFIVANSQPSIEKKLWVDTISAYPIAFSSRLSFRR